MTYNIDFVINGHFYVDDIEADSIEEAIDYANDVFNMTDFGVLWDIDGEIYSIEDENGEKSF